MIKIATLVKPNDVVFVLDASIGQAAKGQADAFKTAVCLFVCLEIFRCFLKRKLLKQI